MLTESCGLHPCLPRVQGRVNVYGTLILTGPRVSATASALLADLSGFTRGCFQRSRNNDPAVPFFFASGSPIAGAL